MHSIICRVFFVLLVQHLAVAFLLPTTHNGLKSCPALFLSENLPLFGEGSDTLADDDSHHLLASLRDRKKALEQGIGKRYKTRTQKGFLNVHMEPGDPYNTANIVNQLEEGEIVTSTGPSRGPWIKHDKGGWSISIYYGHVWLEELRD